MNTIIACNSENEELTIDKNTSKHKLFLHFGSMQAVRVFFIQNKFNKLFIKEKIENS
jgi:hypothetical protein